jgi:hypothetical protein
MPKTYSDKERAAMIEHIVAELSAGRPVSRICREDEGMPDQATFWRWHFADEDLRGKVADARANGVEAMLDEAISIADDGTNDWVKKPRKDDGEEWEFNKENVLRSKLRFDARVKAAQMLKPKTYGPKLDLTSGGEKIGLSAELEAARRRAGE